MKKALEARIVDAIVRDLSDRRGLGDEWGNIDSDVRKEIKEVWAGLVRKHIDADAAANNPTPA
jgi:hypothetical protein